MNSREPVSGPLGNRGEVFVLTPEPLETGGGLERFLRYLLEGFRARGFVTRLFHRGNSAPPRLASRGRALSRILSQGLNGLYIGRAARAALHPGVRLVLSNSMVGWYPLPRDVRQVHFYHGTYRVQAEAIRHAISTAGYLSLVWWSGMVLERASGRGKICLVNSEQTREEIEQHFGWRGSTAWLPVDPAQFRPRSRTECRRALGIPQDATVGLFVGSGDRVKGFDTLQRVMVLLPNVTWLLALRGPRPSLASLPHVSYFQDARDEVLSQLYGSADFSLSLSRYEPFGYVVAESLLCGTPVLATPGGASRALLNHPDFTPLRLQSSDSADTVARAVSSVAAAADHWRTRILQEIRPRLLDLCAPDKWWNRFFELTGLT